MPTYEYKREDGTTFELFQSMNDEPLKTCPDTNQPVRRVISGGGGVVYKGTGFYVTDYKKNGHTNGSSGADKTENPDSQTTEKKKPAENNKE